MNNQKNVIVTGARTPFLKCDSQFKNTDSSELAKIVIRDLIDKLSLAPEVIDTVILGTTNSGSETVNLARESAIRAGLPANINASTIQKGHGSAIEAITTAFECINSGKANVVIAGGADNTSQTRIKLDENLFALYEARKKKRSFLSAIFKPFSNRVTKLTQMIDDERNLENPVTGVTSLITGEKLALKFGITRKKQDNYTLKSHLKIKMAIEENRLNQEITTTFAYPGFDAQKSDNCFKPNISLQKLKKCKPVVDEKYGSVTLENSQQECDGAAVVLLMTEDKADELGLQPMSYIENYVLANAGDENEGLSALFALVNALAQNNLTLEDIDLFEINELTAAHILTYLEILNSEQLCKEILKQETAFGLIPEENLNPSGGSIAFGNPPGAGGARLLLSAMHGLARNKKKRALVVTDIDGYQGVALIIKKMEEKNEN